MFNQTPSEPTGIQKIIGDIEREMDSVSADSDEYARMVDQYIKLQQFKTTSRTRISPDVLATIVANLVGVIAVINHEQTHALTSKALGLVMKVKN